MAVLEKISTVRQGVMRRVSGVGSRVCSGVFCLPKWESVILKFNQLFGNKLDRGHRHETDCFGADAL